ncbi:MAG: hypothetical protein AAF984_04335 [Verrucomicrobiota bacterium]
MTYVKAEPEQSRIPLEITSDGDNRYEDGIAYAQGNVVVRYGGDVIYADEVSFNKAKRTIEGRGNVRIFVDGQIFRGSRLLYNLDTRAVKSLDFRTARDKIFAYGEEVDTPKEDKYVIKKGWLTTHNSENPSYRLKADTIEIYPDDSVVMKNVTVMIGDVPVMWVPIVSQGLGEKRGNFELGAGASSKWGIFALSNYTFALDEKWSTDLQFDWREKRGYAGGGKLKFSPRPGEFAEFDGYYAADRGNQMDAGARRPESLPNEKRYKLSYKQKSQLGADLDLTIDLNKWSDKHVTQDFFESQFEKERVPDNVIDMTFYDANFTASLLGRFDWDDNFEVLERKPELKLEFKRQPIPYTPLYYEGESSIANLKQELAGDNRGTVDGINTFDFEFARDYETYRYDSFHQILYPNQYFGWLNVTPSVGFRGTHYSHDNMSATRGGDEELTRVAVNAGLESSFKVSKTWFDVQDERFGIDGLRHVMEPFINAGATYVSHRPGEDFVPLDYRTLSTRAQPINYTLYNSIDSIDRSLRVRHGIKNKIQTLRDGEKVDLAEWRIYGDFEPESGQYVRTDLDSVYPQIYNDIRVEPVPWMLVDLHAAYGIGDTSYDELNTEITWQVHPAVELSLGQRYLHVKSDFPSDDGDILFTSYNADIVLEDSNLLYTGLFWRINENWQFENFIAYEAEEGRIQEQSYTLYRDLTHWNIATTAKLRSNELIDDEFLLFFTFTLKAFPRASLEVGN